MELSLVINLVRTYYVGTERSVLYCKSLYKVMLNIVVKFEFNNRQYTYKRNTEARSRNHCYRVKQYVLHILSVCL